MIGGADIEGSKSYVAVKSDAFAEKNPAKMFNNTPVQLHNPH